MARPVQVSVAREMISPSSKRSISLQLNMGEGKSSVIVPFVASTLANGSNLVRVVTPRPLSNQMFQSLVGRLSGLAHRPIFYVPISRHLSKEFWGFLRDLYEDCVAKGGVLVVQPDHILSLKLMHIDMLLRQPRNSEGPLIGDRRTSHDRVAMPSSECNKSDEILPMARDVSDKSDENLPIPDKGDGNLPIELDGSDKSQGNFPIAPGVVDKSGENLQIALRNDNGRCVVYELGRLGLQHWLAEESRDVLDESDE